VDADPLAGLLDDLSIAVQRPALGHGVAQSRREQVVVDGVAGRGEVGGPRPEDVLCDVGLASVDEHRDGRVFLADDRQRPDCVEFGRGVFTGDRVEVRLGERLLDRVLTHGDFGFYPYVALREGTHQRFGFCRPALGTEDPNRRADPVRVGAV